MSLENKLQLLIRAHYRNGGELASRAAERFSSGQRNSKLLVSLFLLYTATSRKIFTNLKFFCLFATK